MFYPDVYGSSLMFSPDVWIIPNGWTCMEYGSSLMYGLSLMDGPVWMNKLSKTKMIRQQQNL